jgi:hypothetical protein
MPRNFGSFKITRVNNAGRVGMLGSLFVPNLVSLAYKTFFMCMPHVGV